MRRLAHALLLALALLVPAGPAGAATPHWGAKPYVYVSVDQDIREVLKDFASRLGLTIQISDKVQGTVHGRLPPLPPQQFLDQLARTYGLLWYWDGFILWIYTLEEADSRVLKLQTAGTQQLADTLAELDIWDPRFPIRVSQTSNIIYVTGPPRYVDMVASTADMLDSNRNVTVDMRVFPLRYASADDRTFTVRDQTVTVPGVATILRRLADTGQLQFNSASGTVRTQMGTVTRFVGPGGVLFDPGAGTVYPGTIPGTAPSGAEPQPLAPHSPSALKTQDTEVRIQADPRINAVIIRDLADRMPIYEHLIESLDRKQPLIELEVVIADVSSDRLVNLGVDWNLQIGDHHNGVSLGVGNVAAAALQAGYNFTTAITADPLSVLARLQALETRDEARVLSRPAVLTFDNVEALLDQSQSFFVPLTGQYVANLAQVTTGLLVRVTPHIIDEGGQNKKIQMTIDIEDGTTQPQTQLVGTALPSVTQATISTQGIVGEREALVIGGFYREQLQNNLAKVPFLGDIPVVGWALFQNLNRQRTSATRLVMIRPLVVDETTERSVLSGSLTRDGPPVSLFRPDAKLGLTPEGVLTLDEVRFGTLLGPSVMGRAEDTLCLARAMLSPECKAGPMPSLTAAPFPSVAAAAPTGLRAVPPPALY